MKLKERGFTLIEMMLSVAIIGILVGTSLPIYASFQNRNDLDIVTQSTADALRRAQVYTRSVNGDSLWGVRVDPTAVTLFKGATFATRDATYDEITVIPSTMSVAGLTEVIFSKLYGAPNTTGTITLTASTSDVRVITLNAKGMVSY